MDWYLEEDKGGIKIPLTQGTNGVGRTPSCKIQLNSNFCSRLHCNIIVDAEGSVKLTDFSTNGTYVNGECFMNMDIILSENDKIGIGWWPFESVATKDVPLYTLRKEKPPDAVAQVQDSLQQPENPDNIASVILISDDEDDNLDLAIYSCEGDAAATEMKTNSSIKVPDEVVAKVDLGDFLELPQFLPTASTSNPLHDKPYSTLDSLPGNSMDQMEAIGTTSNQPRSVEMKTSASEGSRANPGESDKGSTNQQSSIETTVQPLETFPGCDENEEQIDIDSLFSQSVLLDIKQEMADLDYEQSFQAKNDHFVKLEAMSNDDDVGTRKNSTVETSPIYIIDDDDEDAADDVNFNNWANKLSQSFCSQKPMVSIPMNNSVYNQHIKRSSSYDDSEPEFLEARTEVIPKIEEVEVKRETRLLIKKEEENRPTDDAPKSEKEDSIKFKDIDFNRVKEVVPTKRKDSGLAREADDEVFETKRPKKQRSSCPEPVPSTSRGSTSRKGEFNHLEVKCKKLEVIDAPNLRTGRGKLRGHSAQHKSTRLEIEKKIRNARMSNQEKLMQDKWRQKPSLERHDEKVRLQSIHERRKIKLKEMAEQQAQKRKSDTDELKVLKKPKVKVTERNRGAYLAEELEAAKAEIHSKKIPKLQSRESLDERKTTPVNGILPRRNSSAPAAEDSRKTEKGKKISEKLANEGVEKASARGTRKSVSSVGNVDTKRPSNVLKSILKTNSFVSKKRYVQFKVEPEIRYYQIEGDNKLARKVDVKDVPMSFEDMERIKKRALDFRPDYSEEIVGDILKWNTNWLGTELQEVNGPKYEPMMMVQQYQTFKEFANIILPLFKLELWYSIQRDLERRGRVGCLIFSVAESYANNKGRHVLQCEIISRSEKDKLDFTAMQLCIVDINTKTEPVQTFGIIASMRCYALNKNESSIKIFLELKNDEKFGRICQKGDSVRIKSVTNIRVEVGIYNAIKNLEFSPLLKSILNPCELLNYQRSISTTIKYKGYNKDLNPNQMNVLLAAYERCVDGSKTNNLFLIEGPPGTGKSRIITNLALQTLYGSEMKQRKKILLCAQSNVAIDIIALKLIEIRGKMDRDKFNLVRFGVYERIHPSVRCVSLQALVQSKLRSGQSDADRNTLKNEKKLLEKQIEAMSQNVNTNTVAFDELQKKKEKLTWINNRLKAELLTSGLESHYPKFLAGANIVCTTLSSCIKLLNYVKKFDVCIIDEATQCAEPYTLVPLQFGISSLVLVGDTQQLPATVLSPEASEHGFGRSLFTRIQNCIAYDENCPIQLLKTQYRMHPEICMWPNSYFYKNMLINHESTKLATTVVKPYAVLSLEYIQDEERELGKLTNVNEAKFVVKLILQLVQIMSPEYFSYGIITPYAEHKDYLQRKINEAGIKRVLVNTIDSYQGKEKDVVIISCVRTKGIGFLGNCQRLNVALTRAMKCLYVCGNFVSLKREPVWNILLENAKRRKLLYHVTPKDVGNFEEKVMCHLRTKK